MDSLDELVPPPEVSKFYLRASVKENGYRMQLHVGLDGVSAFTRQFTPYDLRMFPELAYTIERLPVMIGDAELVNCHYRHLAGFNRVELRIPDSTYWPKSGESKLPDEKIEGYLNDPNLFSEKGQPTPDLEVELAFHGLFAIAHPSTWGERREVQAENLISLCQLPIDYSKVDLYLVLLRQKLKELGERARARVVSQTVVSSVEKLREYVKRNDERGEEGTCVVQTFFGPDGRPIVGPASVKLKKYETIDCALLGLHLKPGTKRVTAENLQAATVGLYDSSLGRHLAVAKINLDPDGVQVKTEDQKEALRRLNNHLGNACGDRLSREAEFTTLHDVFLLQGARVIFHLLKEEEKFPVSHLEKVLFDLPDRFSLLDLFRIFEAEKAELTSDTVKVKTLGRRYIKTHLDLFLAIESLNSQKKKRFLAYFSRDREVRQLSAKIVRPQVLFDLRSPLIIEVMVFDIKWGASPFPAGFHSWYGDSFRFKNIYPTRLRFDKGTTTDNETVYALAAAYTP